MDNNLKEYILMLADSGLILGQRLGEWCGHGPVLEQDIALTNIALDIIGEARNYYHYLAETEGKKEDDYPMFRDERSFRNLLLCELPNGHWGDTIMRQFMYDCYHYHLLEGLTGSKDKTLSAIAHKSIKEAAYHIAFSGEWVIRLGDGTDESHQKIQGSLDDLMPYFAEMFIPEPYETWCQDEGYGPSSGDIRSRAINKFQEVISEATLQMPREYHNQKGGKSGYHTENLGFILAELQYMQRAYPGQDW